MSEIQEISQHLLELRARIIKIAIVIGIITVFVLTFHSNPIEIGGIDLFYPTPDPLNNIAAQITNYVTRTLITTAATPAATMIFEFNL